MMVLRSLLLCLLVAAVPISLTGCGVFRGDKDVETSPPSEAIGKGPGIITGKRGGIIIYQR
jgi:predicted small secreted protein